MATERIGSPDLALLPELIQYPLNEGSAVTLFARCEIEFTGQRSGSVGLGDRLIMCKPDGAVTVHRPEKARAVARQGIRSQLNVHVESEFTRLDSANSNRTETLQIDLYEVYDLIRYDAEDTAEFVKTDTEEEMHEYISANPSVVEEGLRIIEHERRTKHGFVDFYAKDEKGLAVVIEVKVNPGKLTDVDQLQRYVSCFRGPSKDTVRGLLVAPEIGKMAKSALRDNDLEFVELKEFHRPERHFSEMTFDDF